MREARSAKNCSANAQRCKSLGRDDGLRHGRHGAQDRARSGVHGRRNDPRHELAVHSVAQRPDRAAEARAKTRALRCVGYVGWVGARREDASEVLDKAAAMRRTLLEHARRLAARENNGGCGARRSARHRRVRRVAKLDEVFDIETRGECERAAADVVAEGSDAHDAKRVDRGGEGDARRWSRARGGRDESREHRCDAHRHESGSKAWRGERERGEKSVAAGVALRAAQHSDAARAAHFETAAQRREERHSVSTRRRRWRRQTQQFGRGSLNRACATAIVREEREFDASRLREGGGDDAHRGERARGERGERGVAAPKERGARGARRERAAHCRKIGAIRVRAHLHPPQRAAIREQCVNSFARAQHDSALRTAGARAAEGAVRSCPTLPRLHLCCHRSCRCGEGGFGVCVGSQLLRPWRIGR